MRAGWVLWVSLALAPVANAADDMAEKNAVSRSWDRYAETSSQGKAASVDLLSASSLVHFGFLRDAALYASAEQVRRLPSMDRLVVYLLRASQNEDALRKMDDRSVAVLGMERGWTNIDAREDRPLPTLSQVTIVDDYAVGELAPPTETNFQFGPDFDREGTQWKYRYESLVPDSSAAIDRSMQQSGMDSTRMFEMAVANLLKSDQAPRLAVLDRPLLDDSVARVRLNERWPTTDLFMARRIGAVKLKAQDGDPLAQLALGSLKIAGNLAKWVPKDETGGLELLEKSSDAGNANASEIAASYLSSDPRLLDDARLKRILRHAQRAANAGKPGAMSMLGQLYFEGAAGLTRDCRQAAEWQARAEEAGDPSARNNLVWTWATCPIKDQRDPAKALVLAQHLIEQADTLPASELDTLAAAFAANGQFDKAIEYQQRAIAGVEADTDTRKSRSATLKRMQSRLAGYRKGRDYVQDYDVFAELRAGKY